MHSSYKALLFVGAVVGLVGCGPPAPEAAYSGSTFPAKQPAQVKLYDVNKPNRPYHEVGRVEVTCPTMAQGGGFGQVTMEGGCSLDQATRMGLDKASFAGVDALINVQTSAGGNGSIVRLDAVAVKFDGPERPAAPPTPAAAPLAPYEKSAPKGTPAERLTKLKALADQGLITADEYAKRKAEILDEL